MTSEAWAAWVQAVGSILAIVAGFATVAWQTSQAQKKQKKEREDRALVVAFRISVWLGEVSARLQLVAAKFNHIQHLNKQAEPNAFADHLKLNPVIRIQDVLPDLHFLKNGSGDVVQLDCHIRFWDAWLDQVSDRHQWDAAQQAETFDNAAKQLANLQNLQRNAVRHIEPVINGGVRLER